MQILADRNMADVERLFSDLGEVRLVDGRNLSPEALREADILLVRSVTRVDAALLDGTQPAFVGSATSGHDHIDREYLQSRNIPFAWAPGSNADSVVDYVLSAICHSGDALEQLLAGAPLGLLGCGHVGGRLMRRFNALGIQVVACDPWLSPEQGTLDAVLACPVVTVHASLTREQPWSSYRLLDAAKLDARPCPGTLFINTARGEILDSGGLADWLERRPDLQIVLDVWEGEPAVDAVLLERCRFGSAHVAGYSADGKRRATAMLRDACLDALGMGRGGPGEKGAKPVSIEVPAGLGGAALIRHLVGQVYDIREDDRLLRAAMPDGFDRLRREYRLRRELNCLSIDNMDALDRPARTHWRKPWWGRERAQPRQRGMGKPAAACYSAGQHKAARAGQ